MPKRPLPGDTNLPGYLPPRRPAGADDEAFASAPLPPVPVEPAPSIGSPTFRALQEQMRMGIWEYAAGIGYNPWQAMMAMAMDSRTHPTTKLDVHKEIASFLLPKLSSVKVEGEVAHVHASASLQDLMAIWEKEEEVQRADLPPWKPPSFGALDMAQDGDGWELAQDEDGREGGDDHAGEAGED